MILKNVRLAFPSLDKTRQFDENSAPRYEATLIVPADHPQLDALKAAEKAAYKKRWGEKKVRMSYMAVRSNEDRDYDGFPSDGYHLNATARPNSQPTVFSRVREQLKPEDDEWPYAGCYVNASIDIYGSDQKSKGLAVGLNGVQFFAHGEAFGGGKRASRDDFEDVVDEAWGGDEEEAAEEGESNPWD